MGRRRLSTTKPTAIGTLAKAYKSVTSNAETAFTFNRPMFHFVSCTEDEVVQQSRALCRDFIYVKLKEKSFLSDEVLQNEKHDNKIPTDVAKEILAMSSEFEQLYPHLFEDLGTYLKMTYQIPNQVRNTYAVAAREIFKCGITWARVIALFTFTGALTVDCVKQGHGKFGNQIVDCMQKFVKDHLAPWIVSQGGWVGALAAYCFLNHFGRHSYNFGDQCSSSCCYTKKHFITC